MQHERATADVVVRWARPRPHAELDRWLDATERARLVALRQPVDRDRFATARAALKALVGNLAGLDPAGVALAYPCPLCERPHGRPVVVAPGAATAWSVSIAHAADRVLVAATRVGAVGVDVEDTTEPRPDLLDVARIALAADEQAVVQALPTEERERAVLEYWVRKEAVLKAAGVGLRGEPARVRVSPPGAAPALLGWDAPDALTAVQLAQLDVGAGYTAVVAVAGTAAVALELTAWRG